MRLSRVTVTPVAFADPPLLNSVGVHEPFAPRAILEVATDEGLTGLGETYADEKHLDALVEKFCRALARRRDHIPWDIGGPVQPPLPLARMVKESPVTPLDVPLHPRAAAVWRELGYL